MLWAVLPSKFKNNVYWKFKKYILETCGLTSKKPSAIFAISTLIDQSIFYELPIFTKYAALKPI